MKRKGSFLGWRLCLQTSGIFAFLPSHVGGKSRSGALRAAPAHGLAPQSALGSHPCVALSSAAVIVRLAQNVNRTFHVLIKPDKLTC